MYCAGNITILRCLSTLVLAIESEHTVINISPDLKQVQLGDSFSETPGSSKSQ